MVQLVPSGALDSVGQINVHGDSVTEDHNDCGIPVCFLLKYYYYNINQSITDHGLTLQLAPSQV
jgi:hypothetical protein